MATLDIILFGPPCAERDGVPVSFHRHHALALLAFLAVTDRPHSRETLAALFWPEMDEVAAHAALRRDLYYLGCAIGKGWLHCEEHCLALPAQPGLSVDVRRFVALAANVIGHDHPAGQVCDGCLAALAEAARLYRGDFLAGFTLRRSVEFDDWQSATTENLRLALADVLAKLAVGLEARGQIDLALAHARRRLALDPLDESSHRLLMRLHAEAGNRAAVARQYETCVKTLAAEMGIEPAPETTALYRWLVRAASAVVRRPP